MSDVDRIGKSKAEANERKRPIDKAINDKASALKIH
jgi:hypothetical protein